MAKANIVGRAGQSPARQQRREDDPLSSSQRKLTLYAGPSDRGEQCGTAATERMTVRVTHMVSAKRNSNLRSKDSGHLTWIPEERQFPANGASALTPLYYSTLRFLASGATPASCSWLPAFCESPTLATDPAEPLLFFTLVGAGPTWSLASAFISTNSFSRCDLSCGMVLMLSPHRKHDMSSLSNFS